MPTVYVDDKPYEVAKGANMLEACLGLGFDLPYFCWHPAMGSVGACRQCAVIQYKDADDDRGRLVMSCMTPAEEGTRIAIEAPEARRFRGRVIEWLMSNHPHDCPVCEEGGECHLQDMTVMTGHAYRRFRFNKRTHRNQDLGPFIGHEMNRCIACYRCVRFYREYAGGKDLNAFASHHHVYFGRERDGTLENAFSGNLVEVCPTGVFTDKTLGKRYTRKWDLQTAPSVCVHCALGCNTSPGERYGTLKRIQNRYNGSVNGYFICDRGRFGYDFVNSPQRLREPRFPRGNDANAEGDLLQACIRGAVGEAGRLIGIGSPRATVEANFALRRLVGADNFYSGASATDYELAKLSLDILRRGPARPPTLTETEHADAVLVLGEDLTNTAPRLALNLRQSARRAAFAVAGKIGVPDWQDHSVRQVAPHATSPLFIAAPLPTPLDDAARATAIASPVDVANLGHAVAHRLDDSVEDPEGLPPKLAAFADRVAEALGNAERPLIVAGYGCQDPNVVRAAANVAWALSNDDRTAGLFLTQPETNSLGLAMMEPAPLSEALDSVPDLAVILENDLFRRADSTAVTGFLENAGLSLALDCVETATTRRTDVALPAATFAEGDGTVVSAEGRAQRFFGVMEMQGEMRESWRWLAVVEVLADRTPVPRWQSLDEVITDCAETLPVLAGIREAAPGADFRVAGMRLARQPHRYSGRTAMHADRTVFEPKPVADPDSPFAFSMEGYSGDRERGQIPYFWSPAWNSNQAVNKFQDEIGGPLRGGDPGVRLIEPASGDKRYFDRPPAPFQGRAGQFIAFPVYRIFGSEELSALATDLARRIPAPFLVMHPKDAESRCLRDGETVIVATPTGDTRLELCLEPAIARGWVGISAGFRETAGLALNGPVGIEGGGG